MNLVTTINGAAVTTSLAIAEGTQNEHRAVLQLARTYLGDLEEFGGVAFEMRPFETPGGVQKREIAILNEQQSTLLLTYMRNSDIVRQFKKALVKAFWELAQKAAAPALPDFSNPAAAARAWAEQFEQRQLVEEQKVLLEHKVAEQAPKVQFHDDVAAAINCQTVGEVAKELGTGQNRLFRWLRERGFLMANNEPYQRFVDQGYFKVIPRSWKDRHGELHADKKTLITGKGLTYFHKLINNLPVDLPANDNDAVASA
ncbi:phage antirepressor KilAC domain-containing protein [Chromobacterium haemolyticum]|uniref:phage antirepressor KilAC domain-containing protein n=1 Tax=Chromobacterium haemolyticum TaxID=394935 RepID=UPI001316E3E5|nr:phage regulatory protein/antirepressor Ant [Chromobacterium haemolyticum]BBH13353.1 hypothetical protein CH06BL_26010 [Chromobacterium haemolyticum]